MFDVLVYLYETYYCPDACPEPAILARKLSAVGFEEKEITRALGWLTGLEVANHEFADQYPQQIAFSFGMRSYAPQEMNVLGTEAVGFIQFLESAKVLDTVQREIVIERALAIGDAPVCLKNLKIIVLLVLWSQGKEPDSLMFDELFLDENEPRLLH